MRVEAQASRQLLDRGASQNGAVIADHYRNFCHRDVKMIQQVLVSGVRIKVNIRVRMPVAGKKFAQAQGLGGVPRAEKNHIASAAVDQFQASQNKGTHENLAELRVAGHQRTQIVVAHFQEFSIGSDAPAHQAEPAGNHCYLSGEAAGFMGHNGAFSLTVRLHNFHAAGEQHEEWNVAITWLKQNFAGLYFSQLAQRADAVNLMLVQNGKSVTPNICGQFGVNWAKTWFPLRDSSTKVESNR